MSEFKTSAEAAAAWWARQLGAPTYKMVDDDGDQICYVGEHYVVLEVVEQAIGGWVVIAHAVADRATPPRRVALVYGNPVATALLAHREVG